MASPRGFTFLQGGQEFFAAYISGDPVDQMSDTDAVPLPSSQESASSLVFSQDDSCYGSQPLGMMATTALSHLQ